MDLRAAVESWHTMDPCAAVESWQTRDLCVLAPDAMSMVVPVFQVQISSVLHAPTAESCYVIALACSVLVTALQVRSATAQAVSVFQVLGTVVQPILWGCTVPHVHTVLVTASEGPFAMTLATFVWQVQGTLVPRVPLQGPATEALWTSELQSGCGTLLRWQHQLTTCVSQLVAELHHAVAWQVGTVESPVESPFESHHIIWQVCLVWVVESHHPAWLSGAVELRPVALEWQVGPMELRHAAAWQVGAKHLLVPSQTPAMNSASAASMQPCFPEQGEVSQGMDASSAPFLVQASPTLNQGTLK